MSIAIAIPINRTVYVETRVHVIECAACSIDFGIGDDFMRRRREDHATFYCPNGHSNVYREDNEAQTLRKQLARANERARVASESERFFREKAAHERRSAAATRGHLTRLRNRIANGVCPCCTRSFDNVRRHIAGQHPDWAAEHPEVLGS